MELTTSQEFEIREDQILNCIDLSNQNQNLEINFKIYDDVKLILNLTALNYLN